MSEDYSGVRNEGGRSPARAAVGVAAVGLAVIVALLIGYLVYVVSSIPESS